LVVVLINRIRFLQPTDSGARFDILDIRFDGHGAAAPRVPRSHSGLT